MKKSLVAIAVALASVFAFLSPAPAGASGIQTWWINFAGVGPAKLGMTYTQAKASGQFTWSPCGWNVASGGNQSVWVMFSETSSTINAIYVTRAYAGSYKFTESNGIRVGSTVADLRRSAPTGLSLSPRPVWTGYAPGGMNYVYYQRANATHWAMYVLPHSITSPTQIKPWTPLTTIAISSYKLGAMNGC